MPRPVLDVVKAAFQKLASEQDGLIHAVCEDHAVDIAMSVAETYDMQECVSGLTGALDGANASLQASLARL